MSHPALNVLGRGRQQNLCLGCFNTMILPMNTLHSKTMPQPSVCVAAYQHINSPASNESEIHFSKNSIFPS